MKIRPVGAELFHEDGKDMKPTVAFRKAGKASKNDLLGNVKRFVVNLFFKEKSLIYDHPRVLCVSGRVTHTHTHILCAHISLYVKDKT
jgi:hypothetical protein